MPTLRQLPNGRKGYLIDFRVDGRRHRRHLPGTSRIVAERVLASIQDKIALHKTGIETFRPDDNSGSPDSRPLQEAIDLYLNEKRPHLAGSTHTVYRLALKHLADCLGTITLAGLRKSDATRITKHLQKHADSTTTVNIYSRSIMTFLRWCVDDRDYMDALPFQVRQIRIEKPLPRFITPEELDRIFALVDKPALLAAYRVYVATGIRRNELHNSRLQAGYLHLTDTKGKKERLVPLPPHVEDDYRVAMQANNGHPFSGDYITHKWDRYRQLAGVTDRGKTVHALRHTFACRTLVETGDIYRVKELLGHSSVTTTEVYLRFPRGYLDEIFKSS